MEGGDLETEGGNKKHTTEGKDSTLVLTEVLCSNVKELDEAVFCLETPGPASVVVGRNCLNLQCQVYMVLLVVMDTHRKGQMDRPERL